MIDDISAEDVSSWKTSLDDMFALVSGLFSRVELRRRVRSYLVGLLTPVEWKNSWQLAEAAGDADSSRVQHFLGRAKWSADAVRDQLRS